MSKFEEGDIVRCVTSGSSCKRGEQYRVIAVDVEVDGCEYDLTVGDYHTGVEVDSWYDENFELVSAPGRPVIDLPGVGTVPDPSEGAQKFDSDKPDPTLVPPKAIMAIAKAMGFGASKYGAGNFKQEPRLSRERLLGSVLRHILADLDGEQLDSESGLRHIYHAAAGLAMLLDDPREHDEVPRAGENQQEGDGG